MKVINEMEWKQETHLHVKENTYWEKQRHMNLCYEKIVLSLQFIHTQVSVFTNGEPQPGNVSQSNSLTPFSLYQERFYTILLLRLLN